MNLIMKSDTKNALIQPNRSMNTCEKVKARGYFRSFIKDAPAMTGIASSKVNSTAVLLEIPNKSEAMIVAPDLDTPGNTAANS